MIIRQMDIDDVPKLRLEETWMYDRFRNYFECGIGPAWMVEKNGRMLCAFGALFEWKWGGACEVWFNLLDRKYIISAVKIIKRYLPVIARSYNVKRAQAIVSRDSKINVRFLEFMNFYNETPNGMKHKLHNGKDAFLFARCF